MDAKIRAKMHDWVKTLDILEIKIVDEFKIK